ncbi:MAG: copper chaperone PCu(A)C [Pseudomonadales bacterium]|jgi:copper(I)-binding protein|nr:copper chaperone PCu(A)C [Pseudomonadales bacterium]
MSRSRPRLVRILLAACMAAAAGAHAATLEIVAPWLDEPPPGRPIAAVYMELHNRGSAPLAVVGARSDAAASAAIHGHRQEAGMVRMYAVERLEIPAGSSVELRPGGYHLMLGEVRGALQRGALLPFCLRLEGGEEVCADARVRKFGEE